MKASAGKVLMIVENPYPQDSRVRNEAMRLVNAGYTVNMIAKKYPNQTNRENVRGVEVFRVPWFEVFSKTTESNSKFVSLLLKLELKLGI